MSATEMNQRSPSVKQVYRFGGARWYNGFRTIWTRATSRRLEAALDQWLLDAVREDCRVLDIGCGTGFGLGRLRRLGLPFGSYLGVDLTDSMLAIARTRYADEPRAKFVETDLAVLADTPERFDVVMCTWVASHLDRPEDLFDLAQHLLAPSGRAYMLMMTRPRWYVRWWFAPFARLFQTRFVAITSLDKLPGVHRIETGCAGLATLVEVRKEASENSAVLPVTPQSEGVQP